VKARDLEHVRQLLEELRFAGDSKPLATEDHLTVIRDGATANRQHYRTPATGSPFLNSPSWVFVWLVGAV